MKDTLLKLAAKVKHERMKRDIAQDELAEIAGISVHTLSNIECGTTDVRISSLCAIAKAFDMELDELLNFKL